MKRSARNEKHEGAFPEKHAETVCRRENDDVFEDGHNNDFGDPLLAAINELPEDARWSGENDAPGEDSAERNGSRLRSSGASG